MRYPKFAGSVTRYLLILATLLLPLGATAQVAFVADLMLSQLCAIQNWDTPNMQRWLMAMSKQERMQLFSSVRFSSAAKRCLMEKKPAPVALCDKVIANFVDFRQRVPVGGGTPFQELAATEQDKLWEGFNESTCQLNDLNSSQDTWVPKDLLPAPATTKLLERAERGDVRAQMAAHDLYMMGNDVPKNPERANYWLKRAADLGNVESQYLLGRKYTMGQTPSGVDFAQAVHFLTKAANQGNREAMTLLAGIYEQPFKDGIGFAPPQFQNMKKSLDLYVKAAKLGSPDAAFALGRIYAAGDPVPIDLTKSLFWYEKSAEGLDANAMLKVSELYQMEKGSMNNPKVAQQWRRKADALGVNGHALHLIHYFPWGDAPAKPAAIAAIQLKHAEAGDVDAQLAIAARYAHGEGVKQDDKLAIAWWKRAAATNDPIAQRMLGKYLIDEKKPHGQDPGSPGITWLQKAAAQGDMEAQVTLAYWNVNGQGRADRKPLPRQSLLEAVRLMEEAARRGYSPADTMERAEKWRSLLSEN
jgi:TPR repeat protein